MGQYQKEVPMDCDSVWMSELGFISIWRMDAQVEVGKAGYFYGSNGQIQSLLINQPNLILPIPGEAQAKAMPGWLYIPTK